MQSAEAKREAIAPGQPDPTKMVNQPALQRSQGVVWIVFGGLFWLASLVAFGAMIMGGSGSVTPFAITAASCATLLYLALLLSRFFVREQKLRLRTMAVCMLTMAFVSLLGVVVCAAIESAIAFG